MPLAVVERVRRFELRVAYRGAYGLALAAAGERPVLSVEATAAPGQPPGFCDVILRVPEIEDAEPLRLALPHEKRVLRPAPPRAELLERLERLGKPTPAHLEIVSDDDTLARLPVTLLPAWHWSLEREARVSAAAAVLPGADCVLELVARAAARSGASPAGWSTRYATGEAGVARAALLALYDTLRTEGQIEYDAPRAQEDAWSGVHYQPLRPAGDILAPAAGGGARADCLDLTLLLAGALEALGMSPLLVFTGPVDATPGHAFVGVWDRPGRRFEPVRADAGALAADVAAGRLLVLEATGVCRGAHGLEVAEAMACATRLVHDPASVHAVDVRAARPPQGTTVPLELPQDPVVRQALWLELAQGTARGADRRETIDLLLGLCRAGGPVTSTLLELSGSSAERLTAVLEAHLTPGPGTAPPQPTRHFEMALADARASARRGGAGRVREADLLRSVLQSPSRNVRRVFEAAGCDFAAVLAELERMAPRVTLETESRHLESPTSEGAS